MTYKEAERIILSKYRDSRVLLGLNTPSAYVFAIKPIKMREDILDNMYAVDKRTGRISGWPLSLHAKEYREAIKHPIYEVRRS